MCACAVEDNFWESVLSSLHGCSEDWTLVVRHGSKNLYPLSHCIDPFFIFFCVQFYLFGSRDYVLRPQRHSKNTYELCIESHEIHPSRKFRRQPWASHQNMLFSVVLDKHGPQGSWEIYHFRDRENTLKSLWLSGNWWLWATLVSRGQRGPGWKSTWHISLLGCSVKACSRPVNFVSSLANLASGFLL